MVVDVFAALNTKQFSPLYKTSVAVKLIAQYVWKHRQHSQQKGDDQTLVPDTPIDDTIDMNVLKKLISKSLQEKFNLINQEKVVQFKNTLASEVDGLVKAYTAEKVSMGGQAPDFAPLFNQYQDRFFTELEASNMRIYEQVVDKNINIMITRLLQGLPMDGQTQKWLLDGCESESNQAALANYNELSTRYI